MAGSGNDPKGNDALTCFLGGCVGLAVLGVGLVLLLSFIFD